MTEVKKERKAGRQRQDLTGQRFGKLTVMGPSRDDKGRLVWECRCDCGNVIRRRKDQLTGGGSTSCGCANSKKSRDLTGKRFGSLTVLGPARDEKGRLGWQCRCDCGNTVLKYAGDLNSGKLTSCGCALYRDRKDLTGKRFGMLTVLGLAPDAVKGTMWVCRCDCGSTVTRSGKVLRDGDAVSCGCIRAGQLEDLTGRRFGRLTVIGRSERKTENGLTLWECRCDCGNTVVTRGYSLKNGETTSCGCARVDFCKNEIRDHETFVDNTCIEFIKHIDRPTKANTSGVRGVSRLRDGRYQAYIRFQKKLIYLGKYKRFEDAVKARKRAEDDIIKPYLESYYAGLAEPGKGTSA